MVFRPCLVPCVAWMLLSTFAWMLSFRKLLCVCLSDWIRSQHPIANDLPFGSAIVSQYWNVGPKPHSVAYVSNTNVVVKSKTVSCLYYHLIMCSLDREDVVVLKKIEWFFLKQKLNVGEICGKELVSQDKGPSSESLPLFLFVHTCRMFPSFSILVADFRYLLLLF